MEEVLDQPIEQPEYYYSLPTNAVVIVGSLAIREYKKSELYINVLLEKGRLVSHSDPLETQRPATNLIQFGELLVSDISVIVEDSERLDVSEWEEEHYLSFGHFITNIPAPVKSGHPPYGKMISRNNYLGLGPSVGEITYRKRFKSLGLFYKRLMLTQARRTGTYDEISDDELLDGLRELNTRLGHGATRHEIDEVAREDTNSPSHKIYSARFGSIKDAHEAAGRFSTHAWEEADFRKWGYHFILANGRLFASEDIRFLSLKKRGPSLTKVFSAIGSVTEFQKIANDELNKRASEIKEALENGYIPTRLFRNIKSVPRVITRFACYNLVNELLPHLSTDTKIDVCKSKNHDDFVSRILERNPAITLGEIEVTARWLHVFEELWPNDDYMKLLRVKRPENKQPTISFLEIADLT